MIKDLQKWKEAPIDSMLLSLYQLQCFYSNEIKRGLSGLGEYTLAPCYSDLKLPHVDLCFTRSPEDIVSSIRNSLLSDKENDTVTEEQELPEVSQVAPQSQQMPFSSNKKCESALARAKVFLDSNKLSFDRKLHIFNVEGSSGIPRVVKLHPKLSCSCPPQMNAIISWPSS